MCINFKVPCQITFFWTHFSFYILQPKKKRKGKGKAILLTGCGGP
jgi:hypothetical protein